MPPPLWRRTGWDPFTILRWKSVDTVEQVDFREDVGRGANSAAVDVALIHRQRRNHHAIEVVNDLEDVGRGCPVITIHVAGQKAQTLFHAARIVFYARPSVRLDRRAEAQCNRIIGAQRYARNGWRNRRRSGRNLPEGKVIGRILA